MFDGRVHPAEGFQGQGVELARGLVFWPTSGTTTSPALKDGRDGERRDAESSSPKTRRPR